MKHQKLEGIKIKTFTFLKSLGQGAWAVVYEGIDQRDDSQVAIKVIPKQFMVQTPKLQELVQTEIAVLKQCKNENVVRYVDNFLTDKSLAIVMEYCNGGDLQKYLEKKNGRLAEDQATTFLKQIINGFKGLHEVKAMHRDFKVANVLIHQGVCKIADLGFAKQMQKNVTKTILGTSLTMAPQVLDERPYGFQADIWSVGVVFYQLLYGKYPYSGISDLDILKKIKSSKPDFSGVNISPKAKDFIDKCLIVNPKQRITWKEIYDHPLIKQAQKLIYGLVSRLGVEAGKKFYERGDIKIDEEFVSYSEKNNNNGFRKNKLQPIEVVKEQKSVDIEKLMKQNEQKKKINLAIQKYQKSYLNKRNNIMFIFKHVTPYIYNFFYVKANHNLTLFIISKKAYHDMKRFYDSVRTQKNFMNLNLYFKEFVNHAKYKQLAQLLKNDLEMILVQIQAYREDIQYCSSEIKKQFDLDKIASNNWETLVTETINSYEFQLGEGIDSIEGSDKKDLIRVIEALTYFKQHTENADIEQFDKKIELIDFGKMESKIKQRIQDIYK